MLYKANEYLLEVKRMVEKGEDKTLVLNELNSLHDVIFEGNIGSLKEEDEELDSVNHPAHYTQHPSGVECIEITRHYTFSVGNAIKYLWRAGLKRDLSLTDKEKEIEDLRKAIWYIKDRIKQLEDE